MSNIQLQYFIKINYLTVTGEQIFSAEIGRNPKLARILLMLYKGTPNSYNCFGEVWCHILDNPKLEQIISSETLNQK